MTAKNPGIDDSALAAELLRFWFAADPADARGMQDSMRRWFASSPAEDHELERRFSGLAAAAATGALDGLSAEAPGRLALILLFDQLPRNLHRGTPAAFAQDDKALRLCLDGIDAAQVDALTPVERIFFYMPLQHAEQREIQQLSVRLFERLGELPAPPPLAAALRNCADYAVAHRDIVERFGRFPHRNAALGRKSTAEETAFLAAGGPSFGQ